MVFVARRLKRLIEEELSAIRDLNDSIAIKEALHSRDTEEDTASSTPSAFLPEAVASLIGADVTFPATSTLSIRFEHAWLPIYYLEFERYENYGDTELWILVRMSMPPLPQFDALTGPKSWSFWKSMLFDLADYVSIRNTRSLQWRKITIKFEESVASIELPDSDTARFILGGDLGFIDLLYEEPHSFTPTCLIYVSAGGEVVSSLKRDDASMPSHCGPWSQMALFYDQEVSFIAKCIESQQRS